MTSIIVLKFIAKNVNSQSKNSKLSQFNEIRQDNEQQEYPELADTPILYLDVNFGRGNITRIVMYENDTPEELAEAFCLEHKLDSSKKSKLITIIKKHLDSILDKIEENPYEE